jgi:hypothetical protein
VWPLLQRPVFNKEKESPLDETVVQTKTTVCTRKFHERLNACLKATKGSLRLGGPPFDWMVRHLMSYSSLLPLQSQKEIRIGEKQLTPVSVYHLRCAIWPLEKVLFNSILEVFVSDIFTARQTQGN